MSTVKRDDNAFDTLVSAVDTELRKLAFGVRDPTNIKSDILEYLKSFEDDQITIRFEQPVHVKFMVSPAVDRCIAVAITDTSITLREVAIEPYQFFIKVEFYRDEEAVLSFPFERAVPYGTTNFTGLFYLLMHPSVRKAVESGGAEFSHSGVGRLLQEVLPAFDEVVETIRPKDAWNIVRKVFLHPRQASSEWLLLVSLENGDFAFDNIVVYDVGFGGLVRNVYFVLHENEKTFLPSIGSPPDVRKRNVNWVILSKWGHRRVKWFLGVDLNITIPIRNMAELEHFVPLEKLKRISESIPREVDEEVRRLAATYTALYTFFKYA